MGRSSGMTSVWLVVCEDGDDLDTTGFATEALAKQWENREIRRLWTEEMGSVEIAPSIEDMRCDLGDWDVWFKIENILIHEKIST